MAQDRNHALIIGVADYSAFDASAGNTPACSDLPGARNDARNLETLCHRMGMPARQVTRLDDPNAEALLEAIGRLAEALQSDPEAAALVTFSGHGDHDGAPVLCPADTRCEGEQLVGGIPLDALTEPLEAAIEAGRVTFVLDVCHGGWDLREGRARVLRPGKEPLIVPSRKRRSEILLCAAEQGRPAFEIEIDGEPQGGFSWAFRRVAERWSTGEYLPISPQELAQRATRLLETLAWPQRPVYLGPEKHARKALLSTEGAAEATTDSPELRARTREIWAGTDGITWYKIIRKGARVGWFGATGTNTGYDDPSSGKHWPKDSEFWSWDAGQDPFPESFHLEFWKKDEPAPAPKEDFTRYPAIDLIPGKDQHDPPTGSNKVLYKVNLSGTNVAFVVANTSNLKLVWHATNQAPLTNNRITVGQSDQLQFNNYTSGYNAGPGVSQSPS